MPVSVSLVVSVSMSVVISMSMSVVVSVHRTRLTRPPTPPRQRMLQDDRRRMTRPSRPQQARQVVLPVLHLSSVTLTATAQVHHIHRIDQIIQLGGGLVERHIDDRPDVAFGGGHLQLTGV